MLELHDKIKSNLGYAHREISNSLAELLASRQRLLDLQIALEDIMRDVEILERK